MEWDDWKVLGLIASRKAGIHGERLKSRNHYRRVYETPEVPTKKDLELLERVRNRLGRLVVAEESAAKSWYKKGDDDIPVVDDHNPKDVKPLSRYSNVVRGLSAINRSFLYVAPEKLALAEKRVREVTVNANH